MLHPRVPVCSGRHASNLTLNAVHCRSEVPVVLQSQVVPAPLLDLEIATVTMRLFGRFEDVRVGAAGRSTYNVSLVSDLANALNIDEGRITVTDFQPGSIMATFWLLPSNNPSDASVRDLVTTLRVLQARQTSVLYVLLTACAS